MQKQGGFFMKLLFSVFISLLTLSPAASYSQKVVFEGLKEINGTQLYFKVIGDGEPLLVVHGGPGLNHNYFLPHLEKLAKKYQLIFYDQRSAGQSALNIKTHMNLKTFAADIDAIRIEFGIDKLNILCHSWGALPATEYAVTFPNNIKSIIYCSPVPLNTKYAMQANQNAIERTSSADSLKKVQLLASPGFQNGEMATVNELMLLSFKQVFCDTNKLKNFDPKLPDNYLVASLSLAGLMPEMKNYNYYSKLSAIKAPVLIIHGNCDIVTPETDQKLKEALPNSTITTFERSGHFPFIEENKKFTRTVKKFLKKL